MSFESLGNAIALSGLAFGGGLFFAAGCFAGVKVGAWLFGPVRTTSNGTYNLVVKDPE